MLYKCVGFFYITPDNYAMRLDIYVDILGNVGKHYKA